MQIDKAVEIMGYWLGLEFLALILKFNPVMMGVNLGALAFWGMLRRKDTAKNRRNFFVAFTVFCITSFTFLILDFYKKATSDANIADACADERPKRSKENPSDCVLRIRS